MSIPKIEKKVSIVITRATRLKTENGSRPLKVGAEETLPAGTAKFLCNLKKAVVKGSDEHKLFMEKLAAAKNSKK